jgi:hypothetical protein
MFRRYAGKLDALLISSSPPRMSDVNVTFPGGEQVPLGELQGLSRGEREAAAQVFGTQLRRYAAWMSVPVVNATPHGQFETRIPVPWLSVPVLVMRRPTLWKYIPQANRIVATGSYYCDTQITDAQGTVLVQYEDEADGFALATIELADSPPLPVGKPPRTKILPPDAYDWLLIPFYRRGVRAAWGRHMAPVDRQTRAWVRLVIGSLLGGYIVGRLVGLRRSLCR